MRARENALPLGAVFLFLLMTEAGVGHGEQHIVEFSVQDEHLDIVGTCPSEVQPSQTLTCSIGVRFNRDGLHSLRIAFMVLGPGGRKDFEFTQFEVVPFGEYQTGRSVRSMPDIPIRPDAQSGTAIYAVINESAVGKLHAEIVVSEVAASDSPAAPAWAVFLLTSTGIAILAGLAFAMSVGLVALRVRRKER